MDFEFGSFLVFISSRLKTKVKPGMIVHTCHASTGTVEAGGSVFKASLYSLGYRKPYLKKANYFRKVAVTPMKAAFRLVWCLQELSRSRVL